MENKGEISEWNEGNFKSLRLHQAQEMINLFSMYPFRKTYNEWNYKLWLNAIVVLFKEGNQKYSTKEYETTNKLKEKCEEMVRDFKGLTITSHSSKWVVNVNQNLWETLKQKLEEFEYKVKHLNDQHGLGTRNVKGEGMF